MVRWPIACGLVAATTVLIGSIEAVQTAEDLPIVGVYAQNRECPVSGSPPRAVRVTITPEKITYASGVCTLNGARRQENKITVHVACKQKSGLVLSSDVIFTIRDDRTLDMVDRDGAYKAVLHRCPEPVLKTGTSPETTER